jgi:hypothetical protein
MVSVLVAALVPLGVTFAGENEQVVNAGRPEQAKLTCWLNPLEGVTVIVVVPDDPPVTVREVGLNVTV